MEIEVSLKVRSAIKAKLTELGVHFDDELSDYIMVLVANRRTKQQMESDLELFLNDNTIKFTTWLYHVLKKLETVTLNANPPPVTEPAPPVPTIKPPEPSSSSTSSEKTKVKVKSKDKKKDKESKKSKKSHKNYSNSETLNANDVTTTEPSVASVINVPERSSLNSVKTKEKLKSSDKKKEKEDHKKSKRKEDSSKKSKEKDGRKSKEDEDVKKSKDKDGRKSKEKDIRKSIEGEDGKKSVEKEVRKSTENEDFRKSKDEDDSRKSKDEEDRRKSKDEDRRKSKDKEDVRKSNEKEDIKISNEKEDVERSREKDHTKSYKESHSRNHTRSRSRSRSRHTHKVLRNPDHLNRRHDRDRDRRISENGRNYHKRHHDRSRSPLELFTRKKRLSVKERLGERCVPRDFNFHPPIGLDDELDMGYLNEDELRAMEKDLNIVISVPNVRSVDSEEPDDRNVTRLKDPEIPVEKPMPEILEDLSPIREPEIEDAEVRNKDKDFVVAPNRISIRVMNSSDESGGSDAEEQREEELQVQRDDDSEDELEVTVNDDKDIDDLMPPAAEKVNIEENDEEKKTPAPSPSVDRLAELRAKLAAIKQTNVSSYLPLGYNSPSALATTITKPSLATTSHVGSSNLISAVSSSSSITSTPSPTTCKFWPICSFGENCKFLHPKCKYGEVCTKRPNCSYRHEDESLSPPPYKKPFISSSSYTATSTKKPCVFFPNCLSMDCPFFHPKPCRYGVACTDSRCKNYHPGDGSIGERERGGEHQKKGKLPAMHQLKWSKGRSEIT